MTTPTGFIQMSDVNVEIGRAWNAYTGLNDGPVRSLASLPSGYISLANLMGKSAYTPMNGSSSGIYDEQTAPGVQYTQNWNPSVSVSGGSGGYSFYWTFTSNPNAFTLVGGTETGQSCQIRHSISKFGFGGDASMNCQITDNTGHVINVYVPIHVNYYDPNAG